MDKRKVMIVLSSEMNEGVVTIYAADESALDDALAQKCTRGDSITDITIIDDIIITKQKRIVAGKTVRITAAVSPLTHKPYTLTRGINGDLFRVCGSAPGKPYARLMLRHVIIDGGGGVGGKFGDTDGALISNSGELTISEGAYLRNNCSRSDGGGVSNNGIIIMEGGEISRNMTVGRNGGGIYNLGRIVMTGGAVADNAAMRARGKARGDGGGVYNDSYGSYNDVSFTMLGGEIRRNYAARNGGGAYVTAAARMSADGGVVAGNKAERDGGGIWADADAAACLVVGAEAVFRENRACGAYMLADGGDAGDAGDAKDEGEAADAVDNNEAARLRNTRAGSWSDGFACGLNNLDINYTKGTLVPPSLVRAKVTATRGRLFARQFRFMLVGSGGRIIGEARNDIRGNVKFAPLYLAEGEYTLRQDADATGRWIMDGRAVVVRVEYAGGAAVVAYDEPDAVFANEYTGGAGRVRRARLLELYGELVRRMKNT